jgi:hypothetical protein
LGDFLCRIGYQAAGIDDLEPVAEPLDVTDNPVAGDAGLLQGDGDAAADKAVEEGRFAGVGPADDDYDGGYYRRLWGDWKFPVGRACARMAARVASACGNW